MQKKSDPNKSEKTQPPTVVELEPREVPGDFEIGNLPGPDEFEEIHGYSIDSEPEQ